MACTACNSILNGIYKHAPMTKAQINDSRNRDREIVVLTDQLFTDIPSDLESLIKVLHNDDLLEPTRFTPIFDMISDGNDNDRRHIVTWESMYVLQDILGGGLKYLRDGGNKTIVRTGALRSFNGSKTDPMGTLNTGTLTPVGEEGLFSVSLGMNSIVRGNYSTIAGGGGDSDVSDANIIDIDSNNSFIGNGLGNIIYKSKYSSIVGGQRSQIGNANQSVISGGAYNKIDTYSSSYTTYSNTISGGQGNYILSDYSYNFISSGSYNYILKDTDSNQSGNSSIIGGSGNYILGSSYSSILSGTYNYIQTNSNGAISGGQGNRIHQSNQGVSLGQGNNLYRAHQSGVLSGQSNYIHTSVSSFIGGGISNNIDAYGGMVIQWYYQGNSILGGVANNISSGSSVTVSGYTNNIMYAGASSILGGGYNTITGSDGVMITYSVISGGYVNKITQTTSYLSYHDTIAGGSTNEIFGTYYSTISGGYNNYIGMSWGSTVSGYGNRINGNKTYASFIGGGYQNKIENLTGSGNTQYAAIVGGDSNYIGNSAGYSFIGGGLTNVVNATSTGSVLYSAITGGRYNKIESTSTNTTTAAFIGGGETNYITGAYSSRSAIVSGSTNIINNSLDSAIVSGTYGYISNMGYSIIGAGSYNYVQASSSTKYYSSIFSGYSNKIYDSEYCFIGGGTSNYINSPIGTSSIVGGRNNYLVSDHSIIGSGDHNYIFGTQNSYSFIGSGNQNYIGSETLTSNRYIAIITGSSCINNGEYSVIGSGVSNRIIKDTGMSAPQYAAIITGVGNKITYASSHSVILSGSTNTINAQSDHCVILSSLSATISNSHYCWIGTSSVSSVITNSSNSSILCAVNAEITDSVSSVIGSSTTGAPAKIVTSPNSFIGVGSFTYITSSNNTGSVVACNSYITNSSSSLLGSGEVLYIKSTAAAVSNVILSGNTNSINDSNYAIIIGGRYNSIGYLDTHGIAVGADTIAATSLSSTIGGGHYNHICAAYSSIMGGYNNVIRETSHYAGILSGLNNTIGLGSPYASIMGGYLNKVYQGSAYSAIVNGYINYINSAARSIIGSGYINYLSSGYDLSILGGAYNILVSGNNSIIGGGYANYVTTGVSNSILGGSYNTIYQTSFAVNVGGYGNSIGRISSFNTLNGSLNDSTYSRVPSKISNGTTYIDRSAWEIYSVGITIGGGCLNVADYAQYTTIAGGYVNTIDFGMNGSVISGGVYNSILNGMTIAYAGSNIEYVIGSVITGGRGNTIYAGNKYRDELDSSKYNVINGGYSNVIGDRFDSNKNAGGVSSSTIIGGTYNSISITNATLYTGSYLFGCSIIGGMSNTITNYAIQAAIVGGSSNIVNSQSVLVGCVSTSTPSGVSANHRCIGLGLSGRTISPNNQNMTYAEHIYLYGDMIMPNAPIVTSDNRYKNSVSTLMYGLDFIEKLNPVSYKLNVSRRIENEQGEYVDLAGERIHFGLIAQDVKAVIDELNLDFAGFVMENKDDPDSKQMLRYEEFIAPLIKAVQDLSNEVKNLKQQLSDNNVL